MTTAPTAAVRAWARENGYVVSDRGRIPAEVQRAYDAAHGGAAPAPEVSTAPAGSAPTPPPAPPLPADHNPWQVQPGQPWAGQPGQPGQAPGYSPPQAGWPPPPPGQWPAQQPQWPEHVKPGHDGFSIAALVLGILPVCAGLLGIVFGIIALNRISASRRQGRSFAIAGIVCGSLWIVGIIAGTAVSVAREADRNPQGAVTSEGDVDASALQVGDCAQSLPEGRTLTVHLVPCSQPHGGEVYAQFDLTGDRFPGIPQVERFAEGGCQARADASLGESAAEYDLYYLYPTEETWPQGDREVTCLLGGLDGAQLTGSVGNA